MATIIVQPDAYEWRELAKYASGRADQIATILELFDSTLDPTLKNWLHAIRTVAREEAEEAEVNYQNALDIYNN